MFTINTIVRPNVNADREYSICGNSVLQKAKVVKTFNRQANGNNMTIEVLEHNNPAVIGKKYKVDDRYFEAVQQEYIWIDAYKGTDANMVCKGKQYRMNVEDNYNGKIVLGSKGYHVCTDLKHVFKDYDYDFRNRFFKVKALVKATDYQHRNPNNTVLVAKAIKFVQEITEASETLTAKRNSVHR
jgi:hypothetical protein